MTPTDSSSAHPLADRLGINEVNLALRREYLGLSEEDRLTFVECIPFAERFAQDFAREFYDIQFAFLPTARFFSDQALQAGLTLAELRRHLETVQAASFLRMFTGARESWGVDYFEDRLRIGVVHERLHVPLKWHLGAYSVYARILRKRLFQEFECERAGTILGSVHKLLHYDIQAIADSFMAATIESMGLDMGAKPSSETEDLTDRFGTLRHNAEVLILQTETVARGRLDDPLLSTAVPGRLGRTCQALVTYLRLVHRKHAPSATTTTTTSGLPASGRRRVPKI